MERKMRKTVSGTVSCVRISIRKGCPYGNNGWMTGVIRKFGFEITLRQRGLILCDIWYVR